MPARRSSRRSSCAILGPGGSQANHTSPVVRDEVMTKQRWMRDRRARGCATTGGGGGGGARSRFTDMSAGGRKPVTEG